MYEQDKPHKPHVPCLCIRHSYLDFEEKATRLDPSNLPRLVKLYERCLVACARYAACVSGDNFLGPLIVHIDCCCFSYAEFWIRYAHYHEAKGDIDAARQIHQRGTSKFVRRQYVLELVGSVAARETDSLVWQSVDRKQF